jgi:hypothetical protein
MALKLSITDSDIGVAFPDAYARVVMARVDKHQAYYTVEVHASQAAREGRKQAIRTDNFTAQMDEVSGDIYPALYDHLKQQEFYASGVDA